MAFKVAARTVLQLGSELISSDSVAFYELIKNAFDAGSPSVEIDVVARVPHHVLVEQRSRLGGVSSREEVRAIAASVIEAAYPDIEDGEDFIEQLRHVGTVAQLAELLDEANTIAIADTGSGMDRETLESVFLTIGTRSRLKDKAARRHDGSRPVLGEKGIGRLSAMRLGERLTVITSTAGEQHWNLLKVDWRRFSHESDELLGTIPISPETGEVKHSASLHGTTIYVSALTSDWTWTKTLNTASAELNHRRLVSSQFLRSAIAEAVGAH